MYWLLGNYKLQLIEFRFKKNSPELNISISISIIIEISFMEKHPTYLQTSQTIKG